MRVLLLQRALVLLLRVPLLPGLPQPMARTLSEDSSKDTSWELWDSSMCTAAAAARCGRCRCPCMEPYPRWCLPAALLPTPAVQRGSGAHEGGGV